MDLQNIANQKGGAGQGASKDGITSKNKGDASPKVDLPESDKKKVKIMDSRVGNEKEQDDDQGERPASFLDAMFNKSNKSAIDKANQVYSSPQKPQISNVFSGLKDGDTSFQSQIEIGRASCRERV